jgi:hypothetical protein
LSTGFRPPLEMPPLTIAVEKETVPLLLLPLLLLLL